MKTTSAQAGEINEDIMYEPIRLNVLMRVNKASDLGCRHISGWGESQVTPVELLGYLWFILLSVENQKTVKNACYHFPQL